MLNNTEIIRSLTDEQKIALVADIFSAAGEAFGAAGVPHLEKTELDTLNSELGGDLSCPDFTSMASSWNTKLIEFIAGCVTSHADTRRINLIGVPGIGLKTGPCDSGMSEDPYLNTAIIAACMAAIEKSGFDSYVTGCALGNPDIDYLDSHADDGVIYDFLMRAADNIIETQKCAAIELSLRQLKGDWKNVNCRIADHMRAKKRGTLVLRDAPEEIFLRGLSDRDIVFTGASVSALRSAIKNYERMKEDVEHGVIGAEELEKAVAAGTAVSGETLDFAVDRVIDYIKSLAMRSGSVVPKSDDECRNAALFAARESIVLLKNDAGVLPFKRSGEKIALSGELAKEYIGTESIVEKACVVHGMNYAGYSDGYKLDEERSDAALSAATAALAGSETVLVFVGLGRKNEVKFVKHESTALPANQCAVIDALKKSGKKVVAVVVGNTLPSMKFDCAADCVLSIPYGGGQTVKALTEILFGDISPSGRLTCTAYNDADIYYENQKQAVAAGRFKIGAFIGYRRYISENAGVKYPFGFGLSYGKFVYSGLKIASDHIEVTVKNTGAYSAAEVVQLYVGKKSSNIVRPSRELKGFTKVFIDAGKSVQIKIPLNSGMFEIFDRKSGTKKVEVGLYEIYVGSNCADIKLTGTVDFSGVRLDKSVDKLADYLPSVSNIVEDGYRMNAVSDAAGQFRSARPADDDVSYARLFADEFKADSEDDVSDSNDEAEDDLVDFLDESVTVKTTAEGLVKCAAGIGISIDPHTAYEIIAAFYASRVVMLRCVKTEFDMLHAAVCEYFGCPVCIDDTSACDDSDDILGEGDSALVSAVTYAAAHRNSVALAALDNVMPDRIGKIFTQFIRYSTAPDNIKVTYGVAKRTLDVSRNMWFMMRLADEKCDFPAYVSEMSEMIVPKVGTVSATGVKAYAPDFNQFLAACRRAESRYELEEVHWKKIDKLEDFVKGKTAYKLGNKLCVQIERFASVLLECGVDAFEALDMAVADKLVPHIVTALDGKLTADDGSIADILDAIFGTDDSAHMKLSARRVGRKEGV